MLLVSLHGGRSWKLAKLRDLLGEHSLATMGRRWRPKIICSKGHSILYFQTCPQEQKELR